MLAVALEEARLGLAEGGFPSGRLCLTDTARSWAGGTIGVSRRMTLPYTAKPMLSARRVGSADTRTRSW